jgi:hypothetical protein
MEINPYIGLAVNGFFTGIGVVGGQWFFEKYIKKHMDKPEKVVKKIREQMQNELNKERKII